MKRGLFVFIFIGAVSIARGGVWDVTTPPGSEAKSMGDDRIRELKVAITEALEFEGIFPGADPSTTPRFIYTPSTGTTGLRPTGNDAPAGRLYINLSSGTLEMSQGNGTWNALDVSGSSSVTPGDLSVAVAGDGLGGGGGAPLFVQVSTDNFQIVNDTITIRTGGVTTAHVLDGSLTGSDVTASTFTFPGSFKATAQPGFSAYSSADQDNVTGTGGDATVVFGVEEFDTTNNFVSSTFTAPVAGRYIFNSCIEWEDGGAVADFFLSLVTTNQTYTAVDDNQDFGSKCISHIVNMSAGNTAAIHFMVTGASAIVDILGGTVHGGSPPAGAKVTFFSGALLN